MATGRNYVELIIVDEAERLRPAALNCCAIATTATTSP